MEALVTVKDMRQRYGCSGKTARKYIRQMYHYEDPLTAPQWALDEWEKGRERIPEGIRMNRSSKEPERMIVPRKRAKSNGR